MENSKHGQIGDISSTDHVRAGSGTKQREREAGSWLDGGIGSEGGRGAESESEAERTHTRKR